MKETMAWSKFLSSCLTWNYVVLPLHVAYRIYIANRMPIMDCDETFNYWEIVHFLLFQDNSFQTWEYSNEFALRTYAYLTPVVGIGHIYLKIIQSGILPPWMWSILTEQKFDPSRSSKIALFCLLRSTLGALTAFCEVSFTRSIVEQGLTKDDAKKRGNKASTSAKIDSEAFLSVTDTSYATSSWFILVGWFTEFLLLSSTGMAHSAGALLPSSTVMALWMLSAAAYLRNDNGRFCVIAITAALAVGWPFGTLVFVPLGIGVLIRERKQIIAFILLRILPIAMVVQGLVMLIDYRHYGRIVSPTWNILLYNTKGAGDELYGVEPLSYYIKNLMLNFNYVALVGAMGILPLLTPLLRSSSSSSIWLQGLSLMSPFYIWILVLFPRPHKEERFLYPIYPSLCLGAAIVSVSFTHGILNHLLCWGQSTQQQNQKGEKLTKSMRMMTIIVALLWIPAAAISFCRTVALSKYYYAPLQIYAQAPLIIAERKPSLELKESNSAVSPTTTVCTCGEWYRFPSSFYIESEFSNVIFGFASSTFTGQLPQLFTEEGSGPPAVSGNHFNDKNEPEIGSYTPLESCDFLIELSTSLHSCVGQKGGNNETEWKTIAKEPFLDSEATNSALHRILYLPILHEYAVQSGNVQYVDFVLYGR